MIDADETLIAEAGRRLAAAAPDAKVILFGSRRCQTNQRNSGFCGLRPVATVGAR
jgi:nicotinic acid phosphoribosyltransferase